MTTPNGIESATDLQSVASAAPGPIEGSAGATLPPIRRYLYTPERKAVVNVRELLVWIQTLERDHSKRTVARLAREMRRALDAGLEVKVEAE